MSMYELVFGDGSAGALLIVALRIAETVPRYRSAWMELDEAGEPRIAVYTRVGGGNREEYVHEIAALGCHELYLFDRDDEFDSTYATFYFGVPELLATALDVKMPDWREKLQPPVDTSQRWLDAIDQLKNGTTDG